ncbi:MAG: T9SS type A sorting domain-containing protein [Bacteroidales bacterium]|jgi:hypothetical protein|nr:T9SS type A sorting domain-containing protein [Bacteroidales bacterium]
MKKILLSALISFICLSLISQSCLPEGITFTTQAQIDSFQINYPNCAEIEGDVTIGQWPPGDIVNLNELSVLTSIGGELSINNTQFLTNLSDLYNLNSIGDGLVIGYNDSLQNLTGLNNITSIDGPITIYSNKELTSLTGLEGLTSVEGNIEITGNEKLTNLSGLVNLGSLGGNLIIGDYVKYPEFWVCRGNSSLESISSLCKLTSITGDLYVICNTSLTDLIGLHNITSVGGDLIISSNDSLVNLLSLSHLDTIYGNLEIGVTGGGFVLWQYGNKSITDLSGLDNLEYIGGDLNILGNDSLNSLSGLNNLNEGSIMNLSIIRNKNLSACNAQSICSYLASPNGIVEIRNNAPGCNNPGEVASECGFSMPCLPYGNYFLLSQSDVDNFQNNYQGCTELEGDVIINGDDITNLNGLSGVTSLSGSLVFGDWIFGGNPSLSNLEGLEGLNSIGNDLRINKSSLLDLTGLNNLGSIGGNLSVEDNSVLANLSGLEDLDSIGGGFYIKDNDSLTSLAGLENLVSIGERLYIASNNALTSLAGLGKVAYIGGTLSIRYNETLSTCDIQSICNYLDAPNGDIFINDNALGCNSTEEVLDSCLLSVAEHGLRFEFKIHPNPLTTSTTIEYELKEPEKVTLKIYDYLGKQVYQTQVIQPQGKQQLIWNAEGYAGGIYYYRLQVGDALANGKMVKVR